MHTGAQMRLHTGTRVRVTYRNMGKGYLYTGAMVKVTCWNTDEVTHRNVGNSENAKHQGAVSLPAV